MDTSINWFEIPATDIARAANFYSTILEHEVAIQDFGEFKMATLSNVPGALTGALMQYQSYVPSETHGPLIYLNAGEDLQPMLDRVEEAGGKVIMPKRQISPEVGYMAMFIDSEGNRMALHSPS
jgi:predicted enzyme related to lactoylglutathione lyase